MEEYFKRVQEKRTLNPHWRYGQTLFNVLEEMRPDLAALVRGKWIDPFYVPDTEIKGRKIADFLYLIELKW